MSCIKTELIQKYIDKAASEKEVETVEKHLAVCEECTNRITILQHRADGVKKALNILGRNEVAIPGFIAPTRISKSPEAIRLKRSALRLLAASVLICLILAVLFTRKAPARQEIVAVHTNDREINANQTVTKQEMVINIIDADSKVTSYPLK